MDTLFYIILIGQNGNGWVAGLMQNYIGQGVPKKDNKGCLLDNFNILSYRYLLA